MSDSNENVIEHVELEMDSTGVSKGSISSNNFGSCICFLLAFSYNGERRYLLEHNTYSFDECGMRLYKILERFLNIICDSLLENLGIDSVLPDLANAVLLCDFMLLIEGGDIYESETTKRSFSLLNLNSRGRKICHVYGTNTVLYTMPYYGNQDYGEIRLSVTVGQGATIKQLNYFKVSMRYTFIISFYRVEQLF